MPLCCSKSKGPWAKLRWLLFLDWAFPSLSLSVLPLQSRNDLKLGTRQSSFPCHWSARPLWSWDSALYSGPFLQPWYITPSMGKFHPHVGWSFEFQLCPLVLVLWRPLCTDVLHLFFLVKTLVSQKWVLFLCSISLMVLSFSPLCEFWDQFGVRRKLSGVLLRVMFCL